MRGKSGGLQAVVLVESPQGQVMIKTDRAMSFFTLPHSCDVGVLYVEVRVVYMGVRHEKRMNSSLFRVMIIVVDEF
jgi:hypothetical protein